MLADAESGTGLIVQAVRDSYQRDGATFRAVGNAGAALGRKNTSKASQWAALLEDRGYRQRGRAPHRSTAADAADTRLLTVGRPMDVYRASKKVPPAA